MISIRASRCTARGDSGLPGAVQSVEGTPLDLRDPIRIGGRIDALSVSGGFDHNYVVDRWDGESCRRIAEVIEPLKGRRKDKRTVSDLLARIFAPMEGRPSSWAQKGVEG